MSEIVFDNSLLRAAVTASDQAYGDTESGFNLQWIDNTGSNTPPPFQVPSGWIIADSVANTEAGIKVVIYKNETTNQILAVPMGTNGWSDASAWASNTQDYGYALWNAAKGQILSKLDAIVESMQPGVQVVWNGDSRGGALAQFGALAQIEARNDPEYANLAGISNNNIGIIGTNCSGALAALNADPAREGIDANTQVQGIGTFYLQTRGVDGSGNVVATEQVARTGSGLLGNPERGEHAGNGMLLPDGKARKPYELGVKASIAVTHKSGLMVGARTFPGNPYDGHVLNEQLEQTTILLEDTGKVPKEVIVDLGYRGVDQDNPTVEIIHRGKYKSLTNPQRRWLKRRQAVEPAIGHLKSDHRMDRCWLQGQLGDALHAVLCAAGYNIRWLLRAMVRLGLTALLLRPIFLLILAPILRANPFNQLHPAMGLSFGTTAGCVR